MERLRRVGAIIANELYSIFVDRNALLIMLAAPLALASIIGLAFSGIASGEMGFDPIPVAVVNLDEPREVGGQRVAMGEQFVGALVPPHDASIEARANNELWQIVAARTMTDADAARALVESGELVAALIIPADFSAAVSAAIPATTTSAMRAELYTDPGSSDLADIVESVVSSIGNRIATGNAAISSAIGALFVASANNPDLAARLAALDGDATIFDPANFAEILANGSSLPIERETFSGQAATFNPFALFGSSQAIFFMLFTAMATSAEFLRDKRNGILARLLATPNPISTIILGKIGAAVVTCATQVLLLLIALTLISSVATGAFTTIFGTNIAGLLAVIVAVSLAAAGLAMCVASLARTPEQAQAINGVIAIGMGLLGGAFFNVQNAGVVSTLSRMTINYWAVDAINRLSMGDNDIWRNLGVLLLIGAITLTVAFTRFNRTLEA